MSAPPASDASLQLKWGPYISVVVIIAANIICYFCNDNSVFGRLLWRRRGGSSFFASNTVRGPGWKHSKPNEFWAFDVLDPNCMVTSYFVSEWALLALHALTLLWLMISMVVEQTEDDALEAAWMTFFTHWSLVLLSLAGGLGLLAQARYLWRCRKANGRGVTAIVPLSESYIMAADTGLSTAPDTRAASMTSMALTGGGKTYTSGLVQWDWLTVSYLLCMETAVIAALFLDVYYWAVMVGLQDHTAAGPATYLKHAGNLGIAFLEVCLTRMPIVSVHLQVAIAYATGYAVLVWTYGAVSGVWRYSLDWHEVSSILTYAGIPIALCISMLCWWGVALLRERVGSSFHSWRTRSSNRCHPSVPDLPDAPASGQQT